MHSSLRRFDLLFALATLVAALGSANAAHYNRHQQHDGLEDQQWRSHSGLDSKRRAHLQHSLVGLPEPGSDRSDQQRPSWPQGLLYGQCGTWIY